MAGILSFGNPKLGIALLNIRGLQLVAFGNVLQNGNSSRQPEIGLETMDSSVAQVSQTFFGQYTECLFFHG